MTTSVQHLSRLKVAVAKSSRYTDNLERKRCRKSQVEGQSVILQVGVGVGVIGFALSQGVRCECAIANPRSERLSLAPCEFVSLSSRILRLGINADCLLVLTFVFNSLSTKIPWFAATTSQEPMRRHLPSVYLSCAVISQAQHLTWKSCAFGAWTHG